MSRQCSVDGCELKHRAKGYCSKHYAKFIKPYTQGEDKVYWCWVSIKKRCYSPAFTYYQEYGGRGIEVCERWRESFANFLSDMGKPPSKKHSIERVDTNGNYEPSNCVWATPSEQCANRRTFKNNTSGFTGVSKDGNCWRAYVGWKSKNHIVGYFKTPEEAATWRDAYIIANDWPHTLNFNRDYDNA